MPDLQITLEQNPPPGDVRALDERLTEFNLRVVKDARYQTLRFFLRDASGALVGGLIADALMGWMFVQILWVDDAYRGQGHGAALMRRAEEEARSRGFRGMWLDTFTFQAPGFYRRLGFTEFGRLDDFPPGHSRHFMMKKLG